MPVTTLRLDLPPSPRGTVAIRIGEDLSRAISSDLSRHWRGRPLAIISDSTLARSFGSSLQRLLRGRGAPVRVIPLRAGETCKTREVKAAIEDRLLGARYGPDAVLLAVGGGSILDLAGFVAATFARGVPWIAVPTTLLAMVDASVGGKVGVNHPCGKNLIGAFHHPKAVYADLRFLRTLPEREYIRGLAEVVKMAAGLSEGLFRFLERRVPDILRHRPAVLRRLIAESVSLKARTVSRDERESGYRHVLNFGHTIGHAIESASGYRIAHGEAVAIGMVVESGIALRAGRFSAPQADRLRELLARLGLPVTPPAIDPRRVLQFTRSDKKARGGSVRYALPARIGRMDRASGWSRPIPYRVVLQAWLAARGVGREPPDPEP